MNNRNRRDFLADVGKGMLVASLGPAIAADLGLSSAQAADATDTLSFGPLEPLVAFMQETPIDKLLPLLVKKMADGTDLKTLVAAGALANVRTFGGQDYVGYHSLMALAPAHEISKELPADRRALPVLKVLYRNSQRIQEEGGRKKEVLHHIHDDEVPNEKPGGAALQAATRKGDMAAAERVFAAQAKGTPSEAFNHLQFAIQDEVDVHRVVLSWRAWSLLDLTGPEQAHTLLRQSVRYCVQSEKYLIDHKRPVSGIRELLPKLLDQHKLVGRKAGTRQPDDAWVEHLCETVYGSSRDRAAEAVAAALAEGMSPEAIGQAISLAANRLVLRDLGRVREEVGKPKGSVHGASVGVHASDSANAWRNIARVSDQRNAVASLIVGAFHTAGQSNGQSKESFPLAEQLEKVSATDAATLIRDTETAVKGNDQARACALAHQYGTQGHAARPLFDVLIRYAVSEDGALHAEKYYRTVSEEFAAARPAFRWRHLEALARVTASEFGFAAPGYQEACRLLRV